MIIRHPCKYCIVRASCQRDCDLVIDYGNRVDKIIDSKIFTWSSLVILSLIILALYFMLCYFSSIWWVISIPFLWIGEFAILKYNDFESSFDNNSHLEQVGMFLAVIPATIIILFVVWWEKYYDKYRPSMKGST